MFVNSISEQFYNFQIFLKENPIITFSPHESNKVNHASVLLLFNSKPVSRTKKFVELGCGSGFCCFGLAREYSIAGIGLDIQADLQEPFIKGAKANGLEELLAFKRIDIANIREFMEPEQIDMCIFNPPHYIHGKGESVKDPVRGISRTADESVYKSFCACVSYLLKTKGVFSCVISPNNLEEWMQAFAEKKLSVKSIVPVYGNRENDAQLMLIRGIKNSKSGFVKLRPAVFLK